MSERIKPDGQGEKLKDYEFTVSYRTLNIIERELKKRRNSKTYTINPESIAEYKDLLRKKLPKPIRENSSIPIRLNPIDVDFITGQLLARRFNDGTREADMMLIQHRQAVWELNMKFLGAGGLMETSFSRFLDVRGLLDPDIAEGLPTVETQVDREM